MRRILVVEDEMKISRLVRDYLTHAGFDVTVVGNGEAALASVRGTKPDLVVLDLGLPTTDGLDVARELHRSSSVPIVMLTARGEEADLGANPTPLLRREGLADGRVGLAVRAVAEVADGAR